MVYRPGRENDLCDALSRYPIPDTEEPVQNQNSAPFFFLPKVDIAELQGKDSFCKPIIDDLNNKGNQSRKDRSIYYVLKKNILYRKVIRDGRPYLLLVIPKAIENDLLEESHDSILSGHLGVSRTFARIRDRYFFPSCLEKVARFVASCESCQHRNNPPFKKGGYLQPLPVSGPFKRIHMDYCGPFPVSSKRNQYILLAICPMTKYIMVRPVSNATAINAAHFLVEKVILTHGCVSEILTDRGTHFTGSMMHQLLKLLNIKHLVTTAYHAQCDGQAERALKTFVSIISHFISDGQKNWCQLCHVSG